MHRTVNVGYRAGVSRRRNPLTGYVEFDHPYPAVDLVILTVVDGELRLLLLERSREPEIGWALPGAYVQLGECVEQTAVRIHRDKVRHEPPPERRPLALRPFSGYARDPRRETISLPQLWCLPPAEARRIDVEEAGSPGVERRVWAQLSPSSPDEPTIDGRRVALVFDHAEIVGEAVAEIDRRFTLDDVTLFEDLLPAEFTLRELQTVHEALLGRPVNRDSFRRKVLTSGRLAATGRKETDVEHRPAELYGWSSSAGPDRGPGHP
jgi:8-oxo-dGTP diphosphatase